MEKKNSFFKQRLFQVHISVGITFSLLFYISIFFGIFTIFGPFIKTWEKTSRHFSIIDINKIDYSKIIDPIISNPDYPKNNIFIELPGFMNDPSIRVTHMFVKGQYFNPYTYEKIFIEDSKTQLARFLNDLHYGKPLMLYGKLIFGFTAVAVMFLIIGGLLLVYKNKFSNKGKNQQVIFSKIHRKIFLITSIPLFLVALTGAFMNISYKTAPAMTYLITKGESAEVVKITNKVLKPRKEIVKTLNKSANMLSINTLLRKAQDINPHITLHKLKLINWKDKSARVEFIGYNPYTPFLNGVYNKPRLVLNAVDASIISNTEVIKASWPILLADSLYFLHLLYNVDIFSRIFMALVMIFSAFAIGFAVMLYLEKKAKKFDNKIIFYDWFGKLSLGIMIGIFPSCALLFNLQWLLPIDMENRVLLQKAIFFNFWILTLFWSFYRINSYKAAKDLLYIGGVLFILAATFHELFSSFSIFRLIKENMYSILAVDLSLILIGLILIFVSLKLPNSRNKAKFFWNKNYKGITNV